MDQPSAIGSEGWISYPGFVMYKLRHRWQKRIGALILLAAVVIAILNELRVLPGGHNEFYLAFSAAVGGFGIWWLGWLPLSD